MELYDYRYRKNCSYTGNPVIGTVLVIVLLYLLCKHVPVLATGFPESPVFFTSPTPINKKIQYKGF